jgi:hypothetical protein
VFKNQKYLKYKLGLLYFPTETNDNARRKLKHQIDVTPDLAAFLKEVQPNQMAKTYSPEEVEIIVAWLGEPPFHGDIPDSQKTDES